MSTGLQITEPWFALAEGPVWDAERQRVLWVDILEEIVFVGRLERRHDTGSGGPRLVLETQHHFDTYVGTAVLAGDGALLVAHGRELTRIAPGGMRQSTGPLPLVGRHDRFNDGICDARGRFLVGTLSLVGTRHSQCLLQIGPEGTQTLDDDLGLSNGLAFSPDGGTLYNVDSVPGTIWRRDYDHESGATGAREVVLNLPEVTPDGLTVDAAGNLWVAMWGCGEVRCYAPGGELLDTITVPAPNTTSLAFVGSDLDRLVITTSSAELTAAQLAAYPLSGSLFLADPGCRGLPAFPWSGRLGPLDR